LIGARWPTAATHVHAGNQSLIVGHDYMLPVRALTHRPGCVRVLKYITRHYTSESAGNQKECNMYIGGGLLLLIIVLFLVLR
jgi:hypothetical protein